MGRFEIGTVVCGRKEVASSSVVVFHLQESLPYFNMLLQQESSRRTASTSAIMVYTGILLCFLLSLVRSEKPFLSYKNYDEVTKDRSILIRFVTQW